MASVSQELLRYLIVLLAAPIWVPFVKELWKELNRALRWEGGLMGRAPNRQEREELEQLTWQEDDPMPSEPFARHRDAGAGGFRRPAPPQGRGPGAGVPRPRPGAPRPRPRRGGFR